MHIAWTMRGRIGIPGAAIDIAPSLPARGNVAGEEREEVDVAGGMWRAWGVFAREDRSAAADARGQVGALGVNVIEAAEDDGYLGGGSGEEEEEEQDDGREVEGRGEGDHIHGCPGWNCGANMMFGWGCGSVLFCACWTVRDMF